MTCSTLRRVEPHATSRNPALLSSSSALQYPQTGRTSCNFSRASFSATGSKSCSTLRRVEPLATTHSSSLKLNRINLQYPQTGRTSCNSCSQALRCARVPLAVPSDGSNLLQRHARRKQRARADPCSTLRRVEPLATPG